MRKPAGILLMLLYIAIYIVIAATLGGLLTTYPRWLQLVFFIVAGVVWVFPLRPLFKWMNK